MIEHVEFGAALGDRTRRERPDFNFSAARAIFSDVVQYERFLPTQAPLHRPTW